MLLCLTIYAQERRDGDAHSKSKGSGRYTASACRDD
jgi:hypothetical protein